MFTCPDENQLSELVAGALTADGASELHAHVDVCATCRNVLANLGRVLASRADVTGEGASPYAPLPRGTEIGRYVVLDLLGAGGMGVVYAAYDPELDRRVAIKLVRPVPASPGDSERARSRQLREAKALARLVHPNVVSVFDVGTVEQDVFVAMELVDGTTMTEWMRQSRRSWREILRVLVQAGEGLAAAHGAGLVHRDFKPDNVLVATDGRVLVTDFGLVRSDDASAEEHVASPREAVVVAPLTRTGQIMGTPAYMAPEQHASGAVGPSSDQFSFCVVLFEALHGQRPFAGTTAAELAENVRSGRIQVVAGRDVPRWLDRVIVRGLSVTPEERWPSMRAILDALRHPRRRRRWLGTAVLASVATVAVAGYGELAARRARRDAERGLLCKGAERELHGIWDADRKRALEQAFARTGLPYAAHASATAGRVLDDYARAWSNIREQACEATRIRGDQSEELLDLRMTCLARKRVELTAISDRLVRADPTTVAHAIDAVESLGELGECSDARALRSEPRPPADPTTRAQLLEIRGQLARTEARELTGDYTKLVDDARDVLRAARELGDTALEADALGRLGMALQITGDLAAAERTFSEEISLTDSHGDDRARARALLVQSFLVGCTLGHPAEGRHLATMARAVVDRIGDPPALTGLALDAAANIAGCDGHNDEAVDLSNRAVEFYDQHPPENRSELARVLVNRGQGYVRLGDFEHANADYQRALAINESVYGAEHPLNILALIGIGDVFQEPEDQERARAAGDRAEAIVAKLTSGSERYARMTTAQRSLWHAQRGELEAAVREAERSVSFGRAIYSDDNEYLIESQLILAEALRGLGKLDEARELAVTARTRLERTVGTEHPDVAWALALLGEVELARNPRAALPWLERAVAITTDADGTELADYLCLLGEAQRRVGQLDAAMSSFERARKSLDALQRSNRSIMATPLTGIGEVWLDRHRPQPARQSLERAYALLERVTVDPARRAGTQLALARALWDSDPRDQGRAIQLARAAQAGYARHPDAYRRPLAEADAWLASHVH